jgi:2-polyprenyl-3-methyl-5-hydroxy-6-metoxy-1,4-benzoquinol methylase
MTRFVGDYHDLVRRDVFPQIPGQAGRVLDFGGGVGATSAALRAEGRASRAVLFDRVAGSAAPGVDRAEALDLEDTTALAAALGRHGAFDTILCLDVLEHLRDPWGTVSLLADALAPGGCMVVSIPNAANYRIVLPLLKGRFRYADKGLMDRTHLRWFTRESAIELVKGAGLRVEEVAANLHGRKERVIDRISLHIFEHLAAAQYTIRAGKP